MSFKPFLDQLNGVLTPHLLRWNLKQESILSAKLCIEMPTLVRIGPGYSPACRTKEYRRKRCGVDIVPFSCFNEVLTLELDILALHSFGSLISSRGRDKTLIL